MAFASTKPVVQIVVLVVLSLLLIFVPPVATTTNLRLLDQDDTIEEEIASTTTDTAATTTATATATTTRDLTTTTSTTITSKTDDNSIIGGFIVRGKVPWLAQFTNNNGAGSLIVEDLVLTAANAVDNGNCPESVRIGSLKRDEGGEVMNVIRCTLHPLYETDPFKFDVAILKLDGEVEDAIPITINTEAGLPPDSDDELDLMRTFGFGFVGNVPDSGAAILKAVDMKYKIDCESVLGFNYEPAVHLCVNATDGGGICVGDTGIPLVYYSDIDLGSPIPVQVGIASFISTPSTECAALYGVDVYTRISEFAIYDWINTQIEEQSTVGDSSTDGCRDFTRLQVRKIKDWMEMQWKFITRAMSGNE